MDITTCAGSRCYQAALPASHFCGEDCQRAWHEARALDAEAVTGSVGVHIEPFTMEQFEEAAEAFAQSMNRVS